MSTMTLVANKASVGADYASSAKVAGGRDFFAKLKAGVKEITNNIKKTGQNVANFVKSDKFKDGLKVAGAVAVGVVALAATSAFTAWAIKNGSEWAAAGPLSQIAGLGATFIKMARDSERE